MLNSVVSTHWAILTKIKAWLKCDYQTKFSIIQTKNTENSFYIVNFIFCAHFQYLEAGGHIYSLVQIFPQAWTPKVLGPELASRRAEHSLHCRMSIYIFDILLSPILIILHVCVIICMASPLVFIRRIIFNFFKWVSF